MAQRQRHEERTVKKRGDHCRKRTSVSKCAESTRKDADDETVHRHHVSHLLPAPPPFASSLGISSPSAPNGLKYAPQYSAPEDQLWEKWWVKRCESDVNVEERLVSVEEGYGSSCEEKGQTVKPLVLIFDKRSKINENRARLHFTRMANNRNRGHTSRIEPSLYQTT